MSVLNKIIQDKKSEIPRSIPVNELSKTGKDVATLLKKDRSRNGLKLIAELKRISPSLGALTAMSVASAVKLYEPYANALSILTEKNYFGGNLEDLREASNITNLPLLRKDFIIDPVQVAEARYYGADFYLLIVAAMGKNQLRELIEAGNEFNMPALVEVHNENELEIALDVGIKILGINNRNLVDLSIDLGTTNKLVNLIPQQIRADLVLISESGLKTQDDLRLIENKVDAALMGTVFMESSNPEYLLKKLFG